MAISCEPADLASAAECYACLTDDEKAAVKIYLLAVIAGKDGQTAAQLVDAAKCYACIPKAMRNAVEAYLLCEAANAGGGVAVELIGGQGGDVIGGEF